MDEAAKDIAGAADYLAERPEVTGKVGARRVLRRRQPGPLVGDALRADRRHRRLLSRACPGSGCATEWADYAGKAAVIHCSEEDGTSADEGVQTARRAIEAAGGTCQTYDYPGTAHAFFNDDRPEALRPARRRQRLGPHPGTLPGQAWLSRVPPSRSSPARRGRPTWPTSTRRSATASPARGWSLAGGGGPASGGPRSATRSTGAGRCPGFGAADARIAHPRAGAGRARRQPHRPDLHR